MLATTLGEFATTFVNAVWSTPLFFLLLGCGLIFTIGTRFAQWRILMHGFACVQGKYDDPNDPGAISHFQALCAALSATIGLGNIAGVAVAVAIGGPGAVFWMWVVGLFGMALKFAECSLAVMYRDIRDVPDPSAPALMEADAEDRTLEYAGEDAPAPGAKSRARGEVRGGPMWYMQKALVEPMRARGNGFWVVFKVLAVLFAISTMLNSFGGGNMFQGWNVSDVLERNFSVPTYLSATVVSVLVALVIIGGIQRIGKVASKLVPIMCVVYVVSALFIVLSNVGDVPECLALIIRSAFTSTAAEGSFVGVSFWVAFSWGLRRACFSNEAGEGSAAMAHAAVKTDEPIREGVVAGLEPFIDTLVICTLSALVIIMTGVWNRAPVGTVAEIRDDVILIAPNDSLPEDLQRAYLHEMEFGTKMAIHLAQKFATSVEDKPDIVAMSVDIERLASSDSWDSLTDIALDRRSVSGDDLTKLSKIEVGMPVHVDVEGAELMRFAFDTQVTGLGQWVITIAVFLFAFSTMISWSYYGEKGAEYLFGPGAILIYKFVFVVFVFLGMVLEKFSTVYDFSDGTTGLMVLCNLPAVLMLMPKVLTGTRDYFRRLDSGEMQPNR